MTDGMSIAAIGLIVGLIAIISPIVRLNANITRLSTLVEQLERIVTDKTDELAKRITEHGKEIDDLRITQSNHEARIKSLEK